MKRFFKVLGITFLALIFVAIVGIYVLFWNEINILESVNEYETNGETTVYIMDYETDYHLDEVLKVGATTDADIARVLSTISSHGMYTVNRCIISEPGCEVISAVNEEGNLVWGRNFDWCYSVPIIVRCRPKDGYASISTCEFTNISQNPDIKPNSLVAKFMAVASLYVPMDGVNEKGLCVADLEVKEGGMKLIDTEKTNLTTVVATRAVLNKAATVDEAIEVLRQFDIAPSGGASHHLAISDATGRSVVVEFIDGEVIPVESHYATNFGLLNDGYLKADDEMRERYLTLQSSYEHNDGVMSTDEIRHTLSDVAHTDELWKTRWSIVYEYKPDRIELDYYFDNDFGKKNTVELYFK